MSPKSKAIQSRQRNKVRHEGKKQWLAFVIIMVVAISVLIAIALSM